MDENSVPDHFNEIMPETTDRVLCIRVTKPISEDGFRRNFLPRLQPMLDRHGEIRLLIHYASYKGWEEKATRDDLQAIVQYGPKIRKIAMVSPPKKEIFKSKIHSPLVAGEIQVFTEEELSDALTWVGA